MFLKPIEKNVTLNDDYCGEDIGGGVFFLNIFSKYLGHTKRVKYILGQLSSA